MRYFDINADRIRKTVGLASDDVWHFWSIYEELTYCTLQVLISTHNNLIDDAHFFLKPQCVSCIFTVYFSQATNLVIRTRRSKLKLESCDENLMITSQVSP